MVLSTADKKNVQETWEATEKEWVEKNGFNFYSQMFKNNPAIKSAFNNADLPKQSVLFGHMVSKWVKALDNDANMKSAMTRFVKSHKAKGVTNMDLFKAALNELTSFIKSNTGLTPAQEASWGLANAAILEAMKAEGM